MEKNIEELEEALDHMESRLLAEQSSHRNIVNKYKSVSLRMWFALEHCVEYGTDALAYLMPDFKRSLTHLGVLDDEEYIDTQKAANDVTLAMYDTIDRLTYERDTLIQRLNGLEAEKE